MGAQEQGHNDALSGLGLMKEAFWPRAVAGAGRWVASRAPKWGRTAKEVMIGSPKQFGREVLEGRALRKGSLIRRGMRAPSLLEKGLFYGLPAYEAASIARDKQPNKAERMGGLLGASALGLAAWKPLGIMGSMIAGGVGQQLGAGVGRLGSRLAGGRTPPVSPYGRWEQGAPQHTNPYM